MADDKTTVYRTTFDVSEALRRLQTLKDKVKEVDKAGQSLLKGVSGTLVSDRTLRMVKEEKSARDKLTAAVETYRKGVKAAENDAIKAGKNIEKIIKADERATRKAATEMDRAAKAAVRAQERFKKTFLSIGQGSRSGFGSLVRNAAAATIALVSFYKILSKIGEAKDRYLRFDELTAATMTITHAGEKAFEVGSKGAERYRDALREVANEVKSSAADMADSALFWAKAGQTNADTIVELSKVGTLFARANRDSANNILDQARANDILSDALQLFRRDTSTTKKAMTEATVLGDKLTAAANASNIVVEQLFEYSKKVAGLFKTGEVPDEEIMAIAASLASAGLKEESGVHVRRILTQLAQGSVQKLLKNVGIEVADKQGNIRSFGKIFGELQNVLEKQKPLERMAFLKDLFGQRAVATAAAMAGLNKEGLPGETSISTITEKINAGAGIAQRNQEQYLKTTAGRVQALTAVWGNAFDKVLEESGIIQKVLSGLEGISPKKVFAWMQNVAVPALDSLGKTFLDVFIPGIQMAATELSDWFSPALSVISNLFGISNSSAEGFASTISTLVKLWVKWRIAMLAIRGLRMVDWLASFAKQAMASAAASKTLGAASTTAMVKAQAATSSATGAVGKLQTAFGALGSFLIGLEIGSLLHDNFVEPIMKARHEMDLLHSDIVDTMGRDKSKRSIAQLGQDKKQIGRYESAIQQDVLLNYLPGMGFQRDMRLMMLNSENGNIEAAAKKARDKKSAEDEMRIGPHAAEIWGLRADFMSAQKEGIEETIQIAQDAYRNALNDELNTYINERAQLEQEWNETNDQFLQAWGEDRNLLEEKLSDITGRMQENADAIRDYTGDLNDLSGIISESKDKSRSEQIAKERASIRKGAFHGGKTKEINPFATPLLSGIDEAGNRTINLALQKGNASEYFRKSPEAREQLKRELKSNKNVVNIHYGDASITVTAKTGAKPEDIAKAVKDEWWKIGRRNQEDVQRILGSTVPAEI